MQLPSIGRIVHYTNLGDKDGKYPPETQAALITGVYYAAPADELGYVAVGATANETGAVPTCWYVDLKVFYRTGFFDMQKVPFAEEPKRGHWNWPPRT